MVLSTSSKAKSSAMQNQSQGGGGKKAGLPRATSTAAYLAFDERGLPQSMSFMMLPLSSTVRSNRGIGWKFFER